MSTQKRQDLQGIRGFAIISVLLFHFYPNHFPNGYLGVDQFFVLSGFLMCMLLTKVEGLPTISILTNFYSRRFKRILPLYFLVIFVTVVALYTVFPSTSVFQNQSSANKAIVFLSNRAKTGDEDYYKKLSVAMDLFTHTWSLSVEIQFYFIVPIIFLIGSRLSCYFKYGYYVLLGLLSYSYYSISPPEESFNSVFARIWQFLIGMLAFFFSTPVGYSDELMQQDEKSSISSSDGLSKFLLIFAMILIVVYPYLLPADIVRPLFTSFTGALVVLAGDDFFLSNQFLIYIGDISYSLYLIHWPIYAFIKLDSGENYYALSAGLIMAVLLAMVIFETFEKWYLSISNESITIFILILFGLNVALINKDIAQDQFFMKQISSNETGKLDGVYENMTIDDAERMNRVWNKYDLLSMIEPGCIKRTPLRKRWCDFEGENGPFKIVLFGNSYTLNHHKMVIQECRKKAYNITMYSEKGCEPLAADPEDPNCVEKLKEFKDFIRNSKPDYAFMFTRFFIVNAPFSNNNTDIETDRTYLKMRKQINEFLPFIKRKLFILDSIPRIVAKNVDSIVKNMKKGMSIGDISKTLIESDGYERGRIRHAALVKECGEKCELIDYLPLFWNKSISMVQYFDDRGFSFFNSLYHLSPHGIEHVRPVYRKICSELK